jgi:protein gp37
LKTVSTNSRIEWTESAWNPVTACTKISPGRSNCYAERMARRSQKIKGYIIGRNRVDAKTGMFQQCVLNCKTPDRQKVFSAMHGFYHPHYARDRFS